MGKDLLQEIMRGYFNDNVDDSAHGPMSILNYEVPPLNICDLPVSTHESSWAIVDSPRRLMKTFEFSSMDKKRYFVLELLGYEEENNHHAKITIDSDSVSVEVYTHDVNDVTELDQEYASMADDIYTDVSYYNSQESEQRFEF